MRVDPLDLAAPIIGSLFVAIGAAAAAAALSARPRINRSAAWFAVFCVLYGVRLLARSTLVHVVTGWPDVAFAYISASITYAILVPATLFVESIVGPGRHALIRRTWQLLAVCAAAAIAIDAIARRPFTAVAINAPLVMVSIGVWFWHFARESPRGRWSSEVRAVAAAAAKPTRSSPRRKSSEVRSELRLLSRVLGPLVGARLRRIDARGRGGQPADAGCRV